MDLNSLPRNADGDAIRRVFADGSDPTRPMLIDFHIAIPNDKTGRMLASQVSRADFEPEIYKDEKDGAWTLQASTNILLTYDAVIRPSRHSISLLNLTADTLMDGEPLGTETNKANNLLQATARRLRASNSMQRG